MRIVFTSEESWSRADEIADYLLGPRLWIPENDYPDYADWVERTREQLRQESKRAIVARSGGTVIGAAVYQRFRKDPRVLEVKNITVRPDFHGRHVASFLVRNAEVEGARDFGSVSVRIDAKASNVGVRRLLLGAGYLPGSPADIYGLGAGPDVVYTKPVRT